MNLENCKMKYESEKRFPKEPKNLRKNKDKLNNFKIPKNVEDLESQKGKII